MSTRETYNAVTDTVGGPNIRLMDNLLQGVAVLVCLILGVVIGAVVAVVLEGSILAGCLIGALIGLIVGAIGSGLFLMIYRAIRHARGEHD